MTDEQMRMTRPVEADHRKARKLAQRLVSNTSRIPCLTVSLYFLSCKANSRVKVKNKWARPAYPVMEILSQNVSTQDA
jgi:hypothetical protein